MSNKIRLDIGGPKGNAYYIMGTVRQLCGSREEADEVVQAMLGTSFTNLGGQGNNYEDLLRVYLRHFPFVELYATHDIGIDKELYTLDTNPEIHEL